MPATPLTTVALHFGEGADHNRPSAKKIAGSLSAVVQHGRCLWLASDQTSSIERLTAEDQHRPDTYMDHSSFRLGDFVPLPEGDTEVDVEGLDVQSLGPDAGFLWLVGSHSRARGKVDEPGEQSDAEAIEALSRVDLDKNRCVLIRIPWERDDGGVPQLLLSCPDPRHRGQSLVAGILGRRPDSRLTRTLKGDPHLGSFCSTPGKDNGLDIEGLAVVGDRLLLGLRGPVLRGWAVVLEVTVEGAGGRGREEAEDLQLASRYRKHFLELDGLGVRELCVDGDDLLVLAGPTMNLDGPVRVYRWTAGARGGGTGLVRRDALGVVCDLPYGEGEDHAEGFARFGSAASETPAMLVVFDSPSGARRPKNPGDRTLADVFPWDDRASPGRRHGPRIDFAG